MELFYKKPISVRAMMVRLSLVKWFLLLFIARPALSANKSSALEIPPISLPASEAWYVVLTTDSHFDGRPPVS